MAKHLVCIQSGDWYDESNDDKSMAIAKECGIEALDFNIDHVIDPGEYVNGKEFPLCDKPVDEFVAEFASLKAASEKYGIRFSQMHAPFPTWYEGMPEKTDYLLKVVEKCMAVCAYVGAPAIVVHPYNSGSKQMDVEINLEMYRRLIPAAREYGVKVCLENTFSVFHGRIIEGVCTHAEDSCYLIDELNKEAGEELFGFCLDIGHANITAKNLRAYINTLGKRLTLLHIHDNDGRGDKHLMPYTQTTDLWGNNLATDWEGFIAGLRDIDYGGNLSFETFKATRQFPKDVEKEALSLITAIGRYFRKRIEE
jgi:sugar phosphate isomerase/epimerase